MDEAGMIRVDLGGGMVGSLHSRTYTLFRSRSFQAHQALDLQDLFFRSYDFNFGPRVRGAAMSVSHASSRQF
jgi:hypothetical protein